MTERHQHAGELTAANVDKYLAGLTRQRITQILTESGPLGRDVLVLRATPGSAPGVRDVLAAMEADGTIARVRPQRDTEGNTVRQGGLWFAHDGDAG